MKKHPGPVEGDDPGRALPDRLWIMSFRAVL